VFNDAASIKEMFTDLHDFTVDLSVVI